MKLTKTQFQNYVKSELRELLEDAKGQSTTDWGSRISNGDLTRMSDNVKGHAFAGSMLSLAAVGGNLYEARKWAKDKFGSNHGVTKALEAGTFASGGALLPEEVSSEVIELLRNRSVVRQMNPRRIDLNAGRISIPKQTSAATAQYQGEGQEIAKSEPEFGQIVLDAKKLTALVPVSNDLIRFTSQDALDVVRDDLVATMAVKENLEFLRGDGTSYTPKGLRNWANGSNVTSSNGTSSSNVELDFKELLQGLEGNNIPMQRLYWVMSSRSKNHLLNLRDANGNLVYPEIRNTTPTVYGWPVLVTNAIPDTLGGGSASEVYLVAADHVLLGEVGSMEMSVSTDGSYTDGSTVKSAFAYDQTLIRAIGRHDLGVRHDYAIAVKTGVTWGT